MEEVQLFTTQQELLKWVQIAFAVFSSLIFLLLAYLSGGFYILALLPFIVLDGRVLGMSYLAVKENRVPVLRTQYLRDLSEAAGSLLFGLTQILYWTTRSFSFFWTLGPLVIGLVARFFFPGRSVHECHSFSSLFFFWTRWTKVCFLVNVGVKAEGLADWAWTEVFWSVWIVLCFLTMITLGMFILLVTSCVSYASGEVALDDLISTSWLFYTTAGGLSSFSYFLLAVTQDEEMNLTVIAPIVYLLLFFVITYLSFNPLIRWWNVFFVSDNLDEEIDTERPVSRPSLTSQIISTIKKPPKLLVRLSSTYYKPAEQPEKQANNNERRRALSDKDQITIMEEEESATTHRRCSSSAIRNLESPKNNSTETPKICFTCCEKPCNAVIMDCGHGGICYDCSLSLWKSTRHCYMCREPISQVLQIQTDNPPEAVKVISTTRAVYNHRN